MLYFPFIYFTTLLLAVIRKRGFDMSAYMIFIYAISSFFSIILYNQNYDYDLVYFSKIDISPLPTIIYCGLITFCIYPFYKYNSNRLNISNIAPLKNSTFFKGLIFIFISVFILIILLFYDQIVFNLFIGDLGEIRVDSYNGMTTSITDSLTGISRIIATIVMILGHSAYFLIPLFFYSLIINRKQIIFNCLILLSSTSPILLGILYADRSNTFYWVMLFVLCYIWFKKSFSVRQKFYIKIIGSILLTVLIAYFIAVTTSRFGERDAEAEGSFIIYAGQPFLNFCNLWNNYYNPEWTLSRIFPFFNFFSEDKISVQDWNNIAYANTQMNINVFYTFLGLFLVDIGRVCVFLFPFIINRIANISVRLRYSDQYLRVSNIIITFSIAIILQCGVISYFYTNIDRYIGLIFFLSVALYMRKSQH